MVIAAKAIIVVINSIRFIATSLRAQSLKDQGAAGSKNPNHAVRFRATMLETLSKRFHSFAAAGLFLLLNNNM